MVYALVAIELGGPIRPDDFAQEQGFLFVRIFLLNHIHIFFTYFILLRTREGRSWARAKSADSGARSRFFGVLAFATAIALLSLADYLWAGVGILCVAVTRLYSIHHNMYQTFGLARLYRKIEGEASPARFAALEERLLHVVFALVLCGLALRNLAPGLASRTQPALAAAGLLIAALSFAAAFASDGKRITPRVVFYSRIFLYPLMLVSHYALIGELALHGIGYLFVFRKFLRNTGHRESAANWGLFFVAIGALASVHVVHYPLVWERAVAGTFLAERSWFVHSVALPTTILAFMHCYLDGLLFRSRDPVSRSHIVEPLARKP